MAGATQVSPSVTTSAAPAISTPSGWRRPHGSDYTPFTAPQRADNNSSSIDGFNLMGPACKVCHTLQATFVQVAVQHNETGTADGVGAPTSCSAMHWQGTLHSSWRQQVAHHMRMPSLRMCMPSYPMPAHLRCVSLWVCPTHQTAPAAACAGPAGSLHTCPELACTHTLSTHQHLSPTAAHLDCPAPDLPS
jgi:hypothetical protein